VLSGDPDATKDAALCASYIDGVTPSHDSLAAFFIVMFSRVVELAGKTRALAENALEALDAPDYAGSRSESRLGNSASTAGRDSPIPRLVETDNRDILSQLVEAATNQACSDIDLREAAEVLITQIRMLRENASTLPNLDPSLRESICKGSLVEAIDRQMETGGQNETVKSLIEALEAEQRESSQLRGRLSVFLRTGSNSGDDSEERNIVLQKRIEQLEIDKEESLVEIQRLHRQIAKVVKEKADLELERDNDDKVDARVMRSAFTSLSCQIDNRAVRDNVLRVMAELLQLSPEERAVARIPSLGDISDAPKTLATEFLRFLEEEVDEPSSQLENSFSEI